MPHARLVIGGTGTGVGKTTFTCALQRALRQRHMATLALKPVETGYSDEGSDAARIHLGTTPHVAPLYAFREPLSPHLAAEQEGHCIEVAAICRWVSEQEAAWKTRAALHDAGTTLIELAGGMFTPLSLSQTNADALQVLEPCTFVLVASDRLGVLHDLGACLRALQLQKRQPDLVVFSRAQPDHSTSSNRTQFQRLFPELPSCTFDRDVDSEVVDQLLRRLLRS